MNEFKFVETIPEAPRVPKQVLLDFAAALKEHAGEWGEYPGYEELTVSSRCGIASRINMQSTDPRSLPPVAFRGAFAGAVRKGVLYVKYTGGKK